MKQLALFLIAALLLAGCAVQPPQEVTVDERWSIYCPEGAESVIAQAAACLQVSLEQQCGLALEMTTTEGEKTLSVAVNSGLEPGQYRIRIQENRLLVEAQSLSVVPIAVRSIRQAWLVEMDTLTLTDETCAQLSGSVALESAPFLVLDQNIRYGTEEVPRRLDYLFYNDGLKATAYRVLTDQYEGYISDHYGVAAEYCFIDK